MIGCDAESAHTRMDPIGPPVTAASPSPEEVHGETLTLRPAGELGIETASHIHRRLIAVVRDRRVRAVVVDLSAAEGMHSAVVAAVTLASRRLRGKGKSLVVRGLADHHRAAFGLAAAGSPELKRARRPRLVERIGAGVVGVVTGAEGLLHFGAAIARASGAALLARRHGRLPLGALIQQGSIIGADAVPIVGLLSLLLGLTIAFQSALQLDQFGAGLYLADIVCLSMVRELGPMMTAILISARSGSAITSELSAMNVREEIDAMRTMGINPFTHLVLPRLAALSVVLPALTLLAALLGILGGLVISITQLQLSPQIFVERALEALSLGDFAHGLLKSVLFAWIIGVTSCYIGLGTRGAAQNIGSATTRTVVTSLFLIIVADSIIATTLAVM
ncbi:MAG TPA: ABC transporter permease [Kofleriaceae bacterium]|nr:ABC transporter permease [Kofleriaceae bacterium]